MTFLFSFSFMFLYIFTALLFFFCFFCGGLIFEWVVGSWSGLDLSFSMVFDTLSLGFFSCVSFISFVVFVYSMFYMEGTVDFRRFSWLVFLFVISMFLLVFSGNFFTLMIGWDGLGLVSFCLVIFYSNFSSLESGLVTVFSNRVGDAFFLLSFFLFFLCGWVNWDFFNSSFWGIFLFFIFLGAITKSAQVPFSAWLPAAMAAPTPVSSLVHSSTLVTAGVYVLIRFGYFFSFFSFYSVGLVFLVTMVLAGLSACLETDFKKVVAMSTLSQLGMMMFILSFGLWVLSFIHMVIHAFFKSMLFLSTGSAMSHLIGGQDSRFFGGFLFSYCSFLFFVASGLCLSGFPFFIGFYSKDFIINGVSGGGGQIVFFVFLVGCFFTIFYSLRMVYLGYISFFGGSSFVFVLESILFFFLVGILFLKGWVLGGLFFWFFLSEFIFFFCFYDLFIGLGLMFLGIVLFGVIKFFYKLFFFGALISFLRWFSSSGVSFMLKFFIFHKLDASWSEMLGGRGSFYFLKSLEVGSRSFYGISTGSVIVGGVIFFSFV